MCDFYILNLSEAKRWNDCLNKFPLEQRDIYFTPEYYELYEKHGDGRARCFVYEDGEHIVLYPFLINCVNELGYDLDIPYYDIQGAYGYNGVLTNSPSITMLDSFFARFDEYCKQSNIIAEFVRVNPLLENPLLNRPNFSLIHDRDNVFVDLLNDNIFETKYEYSTRKNIRKAVRSGLTFDWLLGNEMTNRDLESFCEIYNHTMRRNDADQRYYFGTEFFEGISETLREKALFVFVSIGRRVISCELVLLGGGIAYSFLGGTLSDYFQYRPNDFLKHNTIEILKEMGFHKYLLGGGSKGVLRYKKSFSKDGVIEFFIGKKIHNKDVYDEVVDQWSERNTEKVELYRNLLLKYRY